jgi:hypothetical protein
LNVRECGHAHEQPAAPIAAAMKSIAGSLLPDKKTPISD